MLNLFARRCLAPMFGLAALPAIAAAQPVTHVIDFFPDLPGTYLSQLRFIGPQEGTIVEARFIVEFTTQQGFRAEDLLFQMVAPVDNPTTFGFWEVTGADLGWNGFGTFTATFVSHDLDGEIFNGLWGWNLWSVNDPPEYRGGWAELSRVEIDIVPPPSTCGSADFDGDGDVGTDADIEAFFQCLGGNCCETCGSADFDGDGDVGTDADIEAFFVVLGGGAC